jgi:hydroxyacylglutathione hydrolase
VTTVETFETPSLGDRTYLVIDGAEAVVIDPQRDVMRFVEAAERHGARITHVLETHVHNDYITGGVDLARRTGATYVLPAGSGVSFEHQAVADGDVVKAGGVRLRVVATPGHTPNHVAYVLEGDDRPLGTFSGGSMLYGAVGRTDLISPDMTVELSHAQYRSVRRLADGLPDVADVHPTHGFGSHCSSGTADAMFRDGTVGDERDRNPALTTDDEDRFVDELLAGLHPYPRYYAHMGPANAAGPAPLELAPPDALDASAIADAIADGAWVVDLRPRRAYAERHVADTVNVELRNDLPTYLGWILPWGTPWVLLGPDDDAVAEARLMLARIGLDAPAGAATGAPDDWAPDDRLRSWPVVGWSEVTEQAGRDDVVVLDVRDGWEFDSGHHSAAVHVPFHELPERSGELPDGEVWVYCATGNRATVAASWLAREGRDVVLIDDFCLPGDVPG